MHQTLYRKWRPLTFDDVVGQEHVTSILRYQIANNKTSHAYLFCGSRGTGKTTCAKLLARALNCEHPENGSPCGVCDTCKGILSGAVTDVIEMDAASNNGVDNIRDIREDVAYAPAECKKRVFIIDEVHMLSTSAFNALLKTLEEPPEHIVFILATTEMHKIPATILSRCQRYDFRRIASDIIVSRLRTIAENEQIAIEDDALHLIAKLAAGGMRDAIGMLELCAGASSENAVINTRVAATLLGTSPLEDTAAVIDAVTEGNIGAVFTHIDRLYKDSTDIGVFWQSLLSFYRDMLVCKTVADPAPLLDLTGKQQTFPATLSKRFTLGTLLYHTRILDDTLAVLQRGTAPARITVECALIKMCDNTLVTSNDALLARISALEETVAAGGVIKAVPSADIPSVTDDPPPVVSAYDTLSPPPDELPWDSTMPPVAGAVPSPPRADAVSNAKPMSRRADTPTVSATPPVTPKKTLRTFVAWQQVMTRLEKHNPATVSFLRECKAYTCPDDGSFRVRCANGFTAKLVSSKPENLTQLLAAINVIAKDKTYSETDLIIEAADAKKSDGYEMIDDIISNVEDTRKE